MMTNNEKQSDIIVRGHRPTTGLDSSKPPVGGSVVTKQLKAIRKTVKNAPKVSAHKQEK